MPADPRLMALPALRKRAEEQAHRRRQYLLEALTAPGMGFYGSELRAGVPDIGFWIDAVARELSDLSRPASRDAVARLVAEALGLRVYATAPTLRRHLYTRGAQWELGDGDLRCMWHGVPTDHPSASNYIYAPDIAAAGDADEALTLIALAVLGGAS